MIKQDLIACRKKLEFLKESEKKKIDESDKRLKEKRTLRIDQKIFRSIVQDISDENCGEKFEWTAVSAKVLQHAAEDFLVGIFEDANLNTEHRKRMTLLVEDVQLVRRVRARYECYIEKVKID